MRSTLRATSTTSSLGGSCSCFGGRGALGVVSWAAIVTGPRYLTGRSSRVGGCASAPQGGGTREAQHAGPVRRHPGRAQRGGRSRRRARAGGPRSGLGGGGLHLRRGVADGLPGGAD